ncbi:DUF4232 domain-containing protein [Saccharopolyspora sp. NPDC050389]|uniref:DUF4232 domain-containing protein n=1 Tax=Saccharopolyspora sp. NPDC050389 TaxID=3155516 RepID=UPI0033FFE65E
MTPNRLRIFGSRTLQASGALLIAGLMAGCGAQSAQNAQTGQVITAPEQNVQPAPPATSTAAKPDLQASEAPEAATGGRATPASSPARAQPNKVERCHTSMLTGSVQNSEAGAGQRYAELVLRNSSNETCTLYGYGGMQLVDGSGQAVPTKMERTPNPGPGLITLAPGESASATLHWTAVPHEGEPMDGPCQPTPARAQVIPPDETDALSVTWNVGPVCGFGTINGSAYHR